MSNYKSSFLTNVVFRVDFPTILGLDNKNPPIQFQSEIKDRFPILETKPGKSVEFKISKEPTTVSEIEVFLWQFFNKERSKLVEITSDSIVLEYFIYNNFKEFFDDVEWAFRKFFNIYDVARISNRIGLRYINQIKIETGDPFDWNNLINPDLVLESKAFITNKQNIKKSMHLLEIKTKVCDLKFQFGMFNSEYPNPIARKEFVLDYDCFLKEESEISEIYGKIKTFNDVAASWFEKSIEDGLRNILEKE
jgi:uncharacterized protein (TIGR04255 family)